MGLHDQWFWDLSLGKYTLVVTGCPLPCANVRCEVMGPLPGLCLDENTKCQAFYEVSRGFVSCHDGIDWALMASLGGSHGLPRS